MPVSHPISVSLPAYGVLFAESVHAENFSMSERRDPYHKVLYVLHGRVDYTDLASGQRIEATPGSALIIKSETRHQIADLSPSTLLLLCIGPNLLKPDPALQKLWTTLSKSSRRLEVPRPSRPRIENGWRRAIFEREHSQVGSEVAIRALAAQTLVTLARVPAESGSGSAEERVATVAREIQDRFYEEWDIDLAASRAGLSRRHFTNLFRASTGKTLGDFLIDCRMTHAERLLRRGDHTVLGVIFSCGFNDVSHFYRLFRRRYGIAPGSWLKQHGTQAG
jgi:AraC-like DNA-binding protein